MMNAVVKRLSSIDPPVSTLQLIVVRMGITYICSLAYMITVRMDDAILGPKGVRSLLVLRGVTGFFALFGVYFSLQYLTLSDATVLIFLTPFCTAIAGALFLKETFRLSQALSGLVSLAGVVLIARPPFLFGDGGIPEDAPEAIDPLVIIRAVGEGSAAERMMAVGAAMVGVAGTSGAYISVRAIGKQAHAMHVLAHYALYSVIAATLGMVIMKTPFVIPSRLDWFVLLILMGIFGFCAQVLMTMGLQRETAGRASMALYTQLIFATILQLVIFHATPESWLSVLGMALILSSALYVALSKGEAKPEYPKRGPISLNTEDYDHLEAGLHSPPGKRDHTQESSGR
jgi:drug/metabolite transporter (DMT)-like permease